QLRPPVFMRRTPSAIKPQLPAGQSQPAQQAAPPSPDTPAAAATQESPKAPTEAPATGDEGSSQGLTEGLAQGLEFAEIAMRNGRTAQEVARSALSLFPKSSMAALVELGADTISAEVEKSAPTSALATLGGKRYIREVLSLLEAELGPT